MSSSKSEEPDINFTRFGRAFVRESAKHCNFAGTDCWTVRIHPRIDNISNHSGYVDGGQTLQISGLGLGGKNISVTVDGVACLVNPAASTATTITCETQPKGSPSLVNFKQPGNYGATHRFYNPTDVNAAPGWSGFTDGKTTPTLSLATTLELQTTFWDQKAGNSFDGWFLAPETGEYKFYLSADDQVKLFFDTTAPFDPAAQYSGDIYGK
jgi:hypothetical protein